tara:strand:+ start:464 stop:3133 length:2670 start_codon:yes stop_codon:yes gene_type:complete
MNDIYIDANVNNSFNVNEENSDFTYKLQEPLELPKGTQISIQQSFINKKGITGGSIEIDEDIYEIVEYIHYITEQAHFLPIADPDTTANRTGWARSTLKIMPQSFASNFDLNALQNNINPNAVPISTAQPWTADTGKILYGETLAFETTGDGQHAEGSQYWIEASDSRHGKCFTDYGGSNMILPQIQWKKMDNGTGENEYYMVPVVRELEIFIPRGVYGIGQLGQLIEDYFNGVVRLQTINGQKSIDRRTDMERKMANIMSDYKKSVDSNTINIDNFDGQPFNSPTLQRTYARNDRRWNADGTESHNTTNATDHGKPVYAWSDIGMDGFTSMDCYNELLAYTHLNGMPNKTPAGTPNPFNYTDVKDLNDGDGGNAYIDFATHAKRRPFYYFTCPEDEGVLGEINKTTGVPVVTDPVVGDGGDSKSSLYGYGLNGYSDVNRVYGVGMVGSDPLYQNPYQYSRILDNNTLFTRMIGTTNFSFEYNTEKNGYEMKGLHQVPIAPSHDRIGIPNSSAGNQVINIKQLVGNSLRKFPDGSTISKWYNGVNHQDTPAFNPPYNLGAFNDPKQSRLIRSILNTPETRTSGIMITNWGKQTCQNNRTLPFSTTDRDLGKNFSDYFNSDKQTRENWEKTIWFKLGFEYDQIANRDKFKKQTIYNKDFDNNVYFNTPNSNQDCGFTTDTQIDNSIITTISTLNNPYEIKAKSIKPDINNSAETNFQIHGIANVARPWDAYQHGNGGDNDSIISNINQFSNSLYKGCSCIPVSIADVGGITASRLPTLTEQSYYLITSDILDNFKDNVKKGEPLALMGVVAKTNLSNQDFIVDKNDITQTLSQSKVINKIRIKVLNPNLTMPILNDSSSILIKISKPNIIPTTLLPPKQIKIIAQEVQTF